MKLQKVTMPSTVSYSMALAQVPWVLNIFFMVILYQISPKVAWLVEEYLTSQQIRKIVREPLSSELFCGIMLIQ